ncbi:MAG TPA: AraC family transcriptional regulator [Anaeromyxobacter sp.]|nr:AraC family transcriptional regulator [Anaeromyxobacter sp.]
MAFVRALLLAYERYGVDPSGALRQGQITPEMLRSPTARITARQMEAISEGAMRELDDEALGWFGRRLPWGTLGMLCRASLPSPNLEVALKRWFRHHRLLTSDVVLALSSAGGRATVSLEERRDLGAMREFCLLSYLRYVHGYACWAVDSRISLLEVGFPFPAPPHGDVYPLLFPGPVSFGADRAHFTFDARYLSLPQRRDDRALREMLRHALPLTVLQYRRDRLLVARVRRFLADHPGDAHDAGDVARHLHLSTRSLHRHLREEGASLQALKDEVRRERAVELLCRTERPVKQVARAVGFADEKAFARAFKAWTGETPRAYRRRGAPA